MIERVNRIINVEVELDKSDPPNLTVTARGEVEYGGWTNVTLLRREAVQIGYPADGYREYDLVANTPEGKVTQQLCEIEATHCWENVDEKIQGVRVYGRGRGAMECKVSIISSADKKRSKGPLCITGSVAALPDLDIATDGATHLLLPTVGGCIRVKGINDKIEKELNHFEGAKCYVVACGWSIPESNLVIVTAVLQANAELLQNPDIIKLFGDSRDAML